ncbi:hypothetical protein SUDANB15_06716 [Streptomyces sp. enrichment culture]
MRARLAHRHPHLRITAEQVGGHTVPGLLRAAGEAEPLVLGSRGLGRAAGFLFASVASAVVARAVRPVVLAGGPHEPPTAPPEDGSNRCRDVVLGLGPHGPHDALLDFAPDAASRRAATLRVVHDGSTPPEHLSDGLRPWRERYPDVEVTDERVIGRPGTHPVRGPGVRPGLRGQGICRCRGPGLVQQVRRGELTPVRGVDDGGGARRPRPPCRRQVRGPLLGRRFRRAWTDPGPCPRRTVRRGPCGGAAPVAE